MGCWAFIFILKGHYLGFFQKPFAASEGAANHMQHLLICFFIISAPI
jgi:hypothetical protein